MGVMFKRPASRHGAHKTVAPHPLRFCVRGCLCRLGWVSRIQEATVPDNDRPLVCCWFVRRILVHLTP